MTNNTTDPISAAVGMTSAIRRAAPGDTQHSNSRRGHGATRVLVSATSMPAHDAERWQHLHAGMTQCGHRQGATHRDDR
jgi:hypothetical protein